jgi:hypothetical protein
MDPQRPPPLPPQALNYRAPGMPNRPAPASGTESYQKIADTVGMVPSLRWKDNVIQAVSIVIGAIVGAAVGWLFGREAIFAVVGAIGGLVAALFISGIVLMFLGWRRAGR